MYKLLTQKGQLFAIALGLISVLIAVGSIVSGVSSSDQGMSSDLNALLKSDAPPSFDFINPAVYVFIALIVIAVLLALVFGILSLVTDIKGSMKVIIGLAGLAILFFALYSTSDAETAGRLGMLTEKFKVSDGVSKLISGGVKTAILAIGVAFVSAVVMEILNLFK